MKANEKNTPTTPTVADRKRKLEATLSRIAGRPVEITVRGIFAFTVSAEGDAVKSFDAVKTFLGSPADWSCAFDVETDMTFAYFSL